MSFVNDLLFKLYSLNKVNISITWQWQLKAPSVRYIQETANSKLGCEAFIETSAGNYWILHTEFRLWPGQLATTFHRPVTLFTRILDKKYSSNIEKHAAKWKVNLDITKKRSLAFFKGRMNQQLRLQAFEVYRSWTIWLICLGRMPEDAQPV